MFTFDKPNISAIPTTLITGFLGVGKEIFIREVPGGCMCCASGVPMQVALNQLISKSKPDRLIIEPTGLGHPKEVVNVLTSGKYQEIIKLQSILCLVDARNLNDTRYTKHPSFIQQLNIADIIIGAKADMYSTHDEAKLSHFISENNLSSKELHLIQQGNIDPQWLELEHNITINTKPTVGIATSYLNDTASKLTSDYKNGHTLSLALQTKLKQNGFIELNNQGEGYFSKGWIFLDNHIFDHHKLFELITSLHIARAKGVILTNKGAYSFNKSGSEFCSNKISRSRDSRIELIDSDSVTLNNITGEQLLMLKNDVL